MEMLKIRNPKASFSYIKVKPSQEFSIYFSSKEEIVDISWAGDYFDLYEEETDGNGMRYSFRQLHPNVMEDWARYSSVVLGQIWAVRQTGRSNFVVVLEQSSPKTADIITVIDPDELSIAIRPKQILEVVLLTGPDPGEAKTYYTATGLSPLQCYFEKIGAVEIELNDDRMVCVNTIGTIKKESDGIYAIKLGEDIDYVPIVPKVNGCSKHFWFRNCLAGSFPAGTYNAGRIYCEAEYEGHINLNLKLRRKDTKGKKLSIPSVQNTIVPYCKNVTIEEVDGEFEDCETVEFVGENKVIRKTNNQIIVCKPHDYLTGHKSQHICP
jgi:hypothetical protein